MELKVFESPGQEWDEFASRYTDLIFYQSIWSEVLRKGLGGRPLYFCLVDGGEIVAGLPGVLLEFKIFKVYYASIPYGNFIGKRSYFPLVMEFVEKEIGKRGIDQVRIVDSPFSEPYGPPGYVTCLSRCSLLDLGKFDRDRIRRSYRSEVQRAIRKAERNGLSIQRADSRDMADIFHKLYLSSMRRNRAAAKYPPSWFRALFDELVTQGRADILFAVKGGADYAAGVVVVYSPMADHYLHNGSVEAHLESRPNDLIIDYIIRQGVMAGKKTLDFMGSEPQDVALLRFKEKWGSDSFDLHTYVKDYHPFKCKLWEMGKRVAGSRFGSWVLRGVRG